MKKILNFYFRFPVLLDYLLGFCVIGVVHYYIKQCVITVPKADTVSDYASETTTVLLTLAGFILTFLTLLITFKTGKVERSNPTLMERFCNSSLYGDTTTLLKDGIKSLLFVTLVIYLFRFVNILGVWALYYWIIFSIVVLLLTILRALFILDNILKFHTDNT
jgi:hypothetical protein